MRKVVALAQLQGIDTTLDRSGERLTRVVAELADRAALVEAEAQHQAATAELHRQHAEQRDLELQVDDLRARLATLEKKLYGGTVMNPKELGAMTDDARQYRNQISPREDRLIELYDAIDRARGAVEAADRDLGAARAAHADRQERLAAERDQLRGTIAEQERQRQAVVAEVDAQSIRAYESLRRTRGGLAVAVVSQRTCQGCRVTLPINEEQRARTSDELVFCQSCGRILHAGL